MEQGSPDWRTLNEPWERLVWARTRKYDTGKAFAEAIGMRPNTYHNHEREPGLSRNARLTAEKAMRFGKALQINWRWLYDGSGNPFKFEPKISEQIVRIVEMVEDASDSDQRRVEAVVRAILAKDTP